MWAAALGEVFTVLEEQRTAWNAGDVARFMEGYERSDATTFVSGGAVKRGYATLLADYSARYATREAMGTLTFRDVELRSLSETVILAIGRFVVVPASEGAAESTGLFTLVLRCGEAGWRIAHDHTG